MKMKLFVLAGLMMVAVAAAVADEIRSAEDTPGEREPADRGAHRFRLPPEIMEELLAIEEDSSLQTEEARMEARQVWREKHSAALEARRQKLMEYAEQQRSKPVERVPFKRRELPENMDPDLRAIMEKRYDAMESRQAYLDQHGGPSMTQEQQMDLLDEWHEDNAAERNELRALMQAYSEKQANTPDASGVTPNQRMEWSRNPESAPPDFRRRLAEREAMREAMMNAESAEERRTIAKMHIDNQRARRAELEVQRQQEKAESSE